MTTATLKAKTSWKKKHAKRQNEQRAAEAYEQRQHEIDDTLGRIKAALGSHENVDSIHWGHVGDLGAVLEQLNQVRDFIEGAE